MRAALLALAALAIALPASAQDRYTLEFAVMKAGVPVASARTVIAEGGQAEINMVAADGDYTFTADLQPEQGDGGENRLLLDAYINRNGEDLAHPQLMTTRGGVARFQMGASSGSSDDRTDGVQVTLSPLAD